MPRALSVLPLALAVVATLASATASSASAAPKTVHLRGTAYEFNNVKVRLGGAAIRVAEDPRLGATAKADGSFDLKVPDGAAITPYINAAGHHTIFLQTFATNGQDLEHVNFQVPSDAIYGALAALLAVPVDVNGDPAQCAIVSTFSTRDVRDVPFDGFTGYGAHGVAGVTASASPALPPAIYFNKDVIPDRTQAKSSKDGGVIWTEVPTGTYKISAHHPSTRFAPFTATCAPGRIVNANPPWGLHELGRTNPAKVTARWSSGTKLTSLRATGLPKGAKLKVGCAGRGCPFTSFTTTSGTTGLRRAVRGYRAGQTLSLLVTAHAFDGKLVRWTPRAGGTAPKAASLCVPLGETRARAACPR
jgi:hypothetical protein